MNNFKTDEVIFALAWFISEGLKFNELVPDLTFVVVTLNKRLLYTVKLRHVTKVLFPDTVFTFLTHPIKLCIFIKQRGAATDTPTATWRLDPRFDFGCLRLEDARLIAPSSLLFLLHFFCLYAATPPRHSSLRGFFSLE